MKQWLKLNKDTEITDIKLNYVPETGLYELWFISNDTTGEYSHSQSFITNHDNKQCILDDLREEFDMVFTYAFNDTTSTLKEQFKEALLKQNKLYIFENKTQGKNMKIDDFEEYKNMKKSNPDREGSVGNKWKEWDIGDITVYHNKVHSNGYYILHNKLEPSYDSTFNSLVLKIKDDFDDAKDFIFKFNTDKDFAIKTFQDIYNLSKPSEPHFYDLLSRVERKKFKDGTITDKEVENIIEKNKNTTLYQQDTFPIEMQLKKDIKEYREDITKWNVEIKELSISSMNIPKVKEEDISLSKRKDLNI